MESLVFWTETLSLATWFPESSEISAATSFMLQEFIIAMLSIQSVMRDALQ